MNTITLATVLFTLFWCSFGATFLDPGARWRFYLWVIGWQLLTPQWDFWLDTLLLLGSFTLFEIVVRAVAIAVRNGNTALPADPAPAGPATKAVACTVGGGN